MKLNSKKLSLLALTLSPTAVVGESTCEIANILYGPVRLDIVRYEDRGGSDGFETALVRSDTFDNPEKNFGAILGEITVDRGSFAVRNTNQVVVGIITPELRVEGWNETCSDKYVVEVVPVRKGAFILLSNGSPVGTITGRFPKNRFGVKTQ